MAENRERRLVPQSREGISLQVDSRQIRGRDDGELGWRLAGLDPVGRELEEARQGDVVDSVALRQRRPEVAEVDARDAVLAQEVPHLEQALPPLQARVQEHTVARVRA